MNKLLFLLQQVVEPLLAMWPLWVLIVLCYVAVNLSKFKEYAKWLLRFGVVVILILVLLRVLLLLVFPFGNRSSIISADSPLVVQFQNGEITIDAKNDAMEFKLDSFDVANGYVIEKSTISEVIEGNTVKKEVVLLHRKTPLTSLNKVWSTATLHVPITFTGKAEYEIFDSQVTLNLSEYSVANSKVSVIGSEVAISFPQAAIDQLYDIRAESSHTTLYIPEGPSFVITENSPFKLAYPSIFQLTGATTHRKEGTNGATITVNITSRNPKTLEVILVNQHNK